MYAKVARLQTKGEAAAANPGDGDGDGDGGGEQFAQKLGIEGFRD